MYNDIFNSKNLKNDLEQETPELFQTDPEMALEEERISAESPEASIDLREGLEELSDYASPSSLKVPAAVQRRFEAQGLKWRWVRIKIEGRDDVENINKRRKEGWVFVKRKEVPEMSFAMDKHSGATSEDLVTVNDVALMKNLVTNVEKRTAFYQEKTNRAQKAVQENIKGKDFSTKGSEIKSSNSLFE